MERGPTPRCSWRLAGISPCGYTTPPKNRSRHSRHIHTHFDSVEAWKFASNNSKGFSLVNVPNYPVTVWYGESFQFAVWLL